LIQQQVSLTQQNYRLSQKLTVPNKGKGKEGNIHTHLRQSFTCKGFFSSSELKTLEKQNSQYPSANDLVQQLLEKATT
jgi:hypothetical protein